MSDESLMVAHAAGDEAAFRVLFDRHAPAMLRAVQRRVPSEDDARDVVQQTFMNVHRARNDFNAERKLKPWLYAIAMNQTREYYRKRYRRNEWSLESMPKVANQPDPRDPVEQFHTAQVVRLAMEGLLDNQREVLEMRWFQDKSYEEISQLVGASVAAVRVRAHRGYERLRGDVALAG